MTWLFALPGKLKLYAIAAGAFVLALLGIYWRGRSDEAAAEHERELNEYIETRKRIDGVHMDDAQQWLRERADKRDL